jgi:hypothetical protein
MSHRSSLEIQELLDLVYLYIDNCENELRSCTDKNSRDVYEQSLIVFNKSKRTYENALSELFILKMFQDKTQPPEPK